MALKLPSMNTLHKGAVGVDAFQQKWALLAAAFDQIHSLKQADCSFQVLYQASYQLVQQGHGAALFKHLDDKLREQVELQRLEVAAVAAGGTDRGLLAAMTEQWQRRVLTTRRITDLMVHLERTFCSKEKKPCINVLSTRIFGRALIQGALAEGLQRAFFHAIQLDRDGEEAPPEMLLRGVAQMLLAIDAAEDSGSRHFFHTILEGPYMKKAEAYYSKEAASCVSSMTVPQFTQHYFARLLAENRRTANCLDPSSVGRVDHIVTVAFIATHAMALIHNEHSGVKALVRTWRLPELQSLYTAFSHLHDVAPMVDATAEYFLEEGTAAVHSPDNVNNPVAFVEKLIDLRERMVMLLSDVFTTTGRIDRYAESTLFRVFEKVVNLQPFTAEYLSRLLDSKLRSQLTDGDIEKAADQVMTVFTRLNDKDLFEAAYRNHLARRLLQGRTSATEEQERIFIQRLKKECGVSVASSLEGMFADRATSDDLMERFRERLQERGESLPLALHVFVLTAGFWPPPVPLALTLPPEMERASKVFRMFYLGRHHGRRFEYSNANGSVDVRLNHAGRRYDVNLPTICAPVLVRFQADEVETVEEIATACGMAVGDVAKAVASLVRAAPTFTGVLALDGAAGGAITPATRVKYNAAFKSKNLKLRIIAAVAKEKDAGGISSSKAREQLDEDRKYKVDAAIVRIMKSRKVLDHQTLVTEVISVTKTFSPAPDLIKKRIEHLIEREFLERTDQRHVYSYLA